MRSYDELERLAARVDQAGGFMWEGRDIHVPGDEPEVVLKGDDALELMTHLWRRASMRAGEREGHPDAANASYTQGWNDCLRALRASVKNAIDGIGERSAGASLDDG